MKIRQSKKQKDGDDRRNSRLELNYSTETGYPDYFDQSDGSVWQ